MRVAAKPLEDDPGGFYSRTVAMFLACLTEEERQAVQGRFLANGTPPKLQMQILGDMLDTKTREVKHE